MKMGGIIAFGAAACLIGAFMPERSAPPEAKPGDRPVVTPERNTGGDSFVDTPDYLSGDLVLQQQRDGHFYAVPAINSVPVDALVDTGASVIALTGSDAQAVGLTWSEADVREVGRGANGPVYGVPVRLDSVELGTFEVHDLEAVIVPEGLDVTLLGQSFLTRIPNVEIADGQMNLSDR